VTEADLLRVHPSASHLLTVGPSEQSGCDEVLHTRRYTRHTKSFEGLMSLRGSEADSGGHLM
jgi:hypothetical protein